MPHPAASPAYLEHLRSVGRHTELALQRAGFEGVILHAGEPPGLFEDDQHYPYKAHPTFKWWVPLLDAPGSLLLVRPGRTPRLIVQVATDFWYLPNQLPSSGWPSAFEVVEVTSPAAAREALPRNLGQFAWIGDPLPELLEWGVGAINPPALMRGLDYARAWKSAYEIDCLRDANRLGVRGHLAAERTFRAGGTEFDIHQAFLAACGQREHELPYNAIVALNEAASILHYQVLRRTPPDTHRSLLLDAGASCSGYGSDITRTWSWRDDDFAKIVAALDREQQRLADLARPGAEWRDIHLAAVQGIAALLVDLGVLRCSVSEAVESGAARLFFPHGIGHLLGLQVHDVGGTMASPEGGVIPKPPKDPALRLTRRLEPGFVVTLEPGLYFIDALLGPAREGEHARRIDWREVDRLRPYGGIRIEDNLAITSSGCENLTRDAFAQI